MIRYTLISAIVISLLVIIGCKNETPPVQEELTEDQLEAREDSIKLAQAYQMQGEISLAIQPLVETAVIEANTADDAADDPAIWIRPDDVMKSLVFGSNKKGGIATYDLSGEEVSYVAVGKVNNIEVIDDVPMGGLSVSILGGTNRSTQSLDLYKIDSVKDLSLVGRVLMDSLLIDDIYGFCFASDKKGNQYAIINGKNGLMQQYLMKPTSDSISLSLARSVHFDDQVEGMVADATYGNLFVGEEDAGVWKLDIDPSSQKKVLLSSSTARNNPNIKYDVEGITLLKNGDEGYLVVSSQGNFSYALFNRTGDHEYVTSFKVVDGGVDGTQETDGLVINTTPLGEQFPEGIIILQDGFNYDVDVMRPQNFKYASVRDLMKQLK